MSATLDSYRRLEEKTRAMTVLVSAFGVSLAAEQAFFFLTTAFLIFIQSLRGFSKPLLTRRFLFPLATLSALLFTALILRGFEDAAIYLASFLLVLQWIFLIVERNRREENHILWMNLVHLGVASVAAYDGLFAMYFVLFVTVMCVHLGARRIVRRSELYPESQLWESDKSTSFLPGMAKLIPALLLTTGIVFFFMPRAKSPNFGFLGRRQARKTGFGNNVNLGKSGRIHKDHRVVMRVKVERGQLPAEPYLRGSVFDIYWRNKWHQAIPEWQGNLEAMNGSFYFSRTGWRGQPNTTLLFNLEPAKHSTIFTAGPTEVIQFPKESFRLMFFGLHSEFLTPGFHTQGRQYRVECWADRPHLSLNGAADRRAQGRCLLLPRKLKKATLKKITASIYKAEGVVPSTAMDTATILTQHFQSKFSYSLDIPDSGEKDPILYFLMESKRGHCEFFASSLALLLRAEGIPTRLINGYRAQEFDMQTNEYVVRESNAHAWVEVMIPEKGWVRFDPTPAAPDELEASGALGALSKWFNEKWARYVMGFSSFDQKKYVKSLVSQLSEIFQSEKPSRSVQTARSALIVIGALFVFLGLFFARRWLKKRRLRQYRAWGLTGQLESGKALGELLQYFDERGVGKESHETLAEYSKRLVAGGHCGPEFDDLARRYGELRFSHSLKRDPKSDRGLARHLSAFLLREKG